MEEIKNKTKKYIMGAEISNSLLKAFLIDKELNIINFTEVPSFIKIGTKTDYVESISITRKIDEKLETKHYTMSDAAREIEGSRSLGVYKNGKDVFLDIAIYSIVDSLKHIIDTKNKFEIDLYIVILKDRTTVLEAQTKFNNVELFIKERKIDLKINVKGRFSEGDGLSQIVADLINPKLKNRNIAIVDGGSGTTIIKYDRYTSDIDRIFRHVIETGSMKLIELITEELGNEGICVTGSTEEKELERVIYTNKTELVISMGKFNIEGSIITGCNRWINLQEVSVLIADLVAVIQQGGYILCGGGNFNLIALRKALITRIKISIEYTDEKIKQHIFFLKEGRMYGFYEIAKKVCKYEKIDFKKLKGGNIKKPELDIKENKVNKEIKNEKNNT